MVIAITGATGFVGGRLVEALSRRGDHVLAFGRRPAAAFAHAGVAEYRVWDFRSGPIAVPQVDGVVHCAGSVSDWGDASEFQLANVFGTQVALETFRHGGRFVHLSTASVYGHARPPGPIHEGAPYPRRNLNDYVRTKVLAEHLVSARDDAVILRPHAIYGPGETKLLPRLLAARRGGRQIAVGDGRNRMSLTHVDNLVHAIECALDRPAARGPFNVADPAVETIDTMLRALLSAFDLPPAIRYIPVALAWPLASMLEVAFRARRMRRPPMLTRYAVSQLASDCVLDLGRAVQTLGYRPHRTFGEALPEMAAALIGAAGSHAPRT